MAVSYTFSKEERLCSQKAISDLFDNGRSFPLQPFRVFWKVSETSLPYPSQVAISVPKKIFKRAVDRNRIKRLAREAWRHNKHILYEYLEQNNTHLVLMIVYTSAEMPQQEFVSQKVEEIVSKLLLILPSLTLISGQE